MTDNVALTTVATEFYFRKKNGYKRPTISVEYQAPSSEGIVSLLQGEDPKVRDMIVDNVHGIMRDHIRNYVDEDLDFGQETLDALVSDGKVSLTHIAHIPRADRTALTKEDLETFAQDYIALMPAITGKDENRVAAAARLFATRFKQVAGDNDVLQVLKDQLGIFVEGVDDEVVERNEQVITWAGNKLDEMLEAKVTVDAL